jgi:hypothetical protein
MFANPSHALLQELGLDTLNCVKEGSWHDDGSQLKETKRFI